MCRMPEIAVRQHKKGLKSCDAPTDPGRALGLVGEGALAARLICLHDGLVEGICQENGAP